jgi:hypothetical protein
MNFRYVKETMDTNIKHWGDGRIPLNRALRYKAFSKREKIRFNDTLQAHNLSFCKNTGYMMGNL